MGQSEMSPGESLDAGRREAILDAMATAGQKLAIHWGHPPWSDSWARQVAETLDKAAADTYASFSWRCECGDLNRDYEAFCYRCGAGSPEEE